MSKRRPTRRWQEDETEEVARSALFLALAPRLSGLFEQ
jgi:hypothetical protein